MNAMNNSKSQRNNLSLIAEKFVLDSIRIEHPEWVDEEGGCPKCNEYYESLSDIVIMQNINQ